MKIRHNIFRKYNHYDTLILDDHCINCGKTVINLMDEMFINSGRCDFIVSIENQLKLLNNNTKCITEQEFIIKGILE